MNGYKKIIKSQKLRFQILKFLSFIPDKWMLSAQYYIKTGTKLNWKNPQRYSEKIQVYKVKYRDNILGTCVDKYKVRSYVESKGLGSIYPMSGFVQYIPDSFDLEVGKLFSL